MAAGTRAVASVAPSPVASATLLYLASRRSSRGLASGLLLPLGYRVRGRGTGQRPWDVKISIGFCGFWRREGIGRAGRRLLCRGQFAFAASGRFYQRLGESDHGNTLGLAWTFVPVGALSSRLGNGELVPVGQLSAVNGPDGLGTGAIVGIRQVRDHGLVLARHDTNLPADVPGLFQPPGLGDGIVRRCQGVELPVS